MANKSSKHLTFKQDPIIKGLVIVISKKVAKLAVNRNKLRRRIKEIVRLEPEDKTQIKGTIYTRKGASELDFNNLKQEVKEIVQGVN